MGHETKQKERRTHASTNGHIQINPRICDYTGKAFNSSIVLLSIVKRVDETFRSATVRTRRLFCSTRDDNFESRMQAAYLQTFPTQLELIAEGDFSDFRHRGNVCQPPAAL